MAESPNAVQERERAYQAALRLLAYRPRTQRELAQRLGRRFSGEAVQTALARLQERGYIDDDAYAREWRRSREERRPRSAALVRRELLERGVPQEMAEAAVEGMDDGDNALRAAQRHLNRVVSLDYPVFYRRLTAYLRRRGFPQDVVRHTVQRVWEEREDLGA
ncbi:MAG: regulatory protein RecX [Chloroflexi bacterium]|nr:regulatory protein RecX [Chloroflexota bacterium]